MAAYKCCVDDNALINKDLNKVADEMILAIQNDILLEAEPLLVSEHLLKNVEIYSPGGKIKRDIQLYDLTIFGLAQITRCGDVQSRQEGPNIILTIPIIIEQSTANCSVCFRVIFLVRDESSVKLSSVTGEVVLVYNILHSQITDARVEVKSVGEIIVNLESKLYMQLADRSVKELITPRIIDEIKTIGGLIGTRYLIRKLPLVHAFICRSILITEINLK